MIFRVIAVLSLVQVFLFDQQFVVDATANATEDEVQDNNIVGGTLASSGEFPFFAAFDGGKSCGGVLISKNRVLTTANCVHDGFPPSVRIGATTRTNGILAHVNCAIRHPKYQLQEDPYTLINDIAILYLTEKITTIDPVVRNEDVSYPSTRGAFLDTVGFGETTPGGALSSSLRKIDTEFRRIDDCTSIYPSGVIHSSDHLCAYVRGGGGCSGDQGGPVLDGVNQLVGLLSFAYGCADIEYYDVATNVAYYTNWIRDRVADVDCATPSTPAPTASPTPDCFFSNHLRTGVASRIKESIGQFVGNFRIRGNDNGGD